MRLPSVLLDQAGPLMLSGFLFARKRGKDVALLPGIEDDARLVRLSDNTMPLLPLRSDYPELLNENRDT